MKRTIALAVGLFVGAMWLAAPAHATPEPAPTADAAPTATTPADPCALPSPQPTLEEVPQVKGPAVLDLRKRPKLPLPAECFVELEDVCAGTNVTLKNPVPIPIKYLVNGVDGTHTVSFGETEQVVVPKSESPFGIWIVISDEEDGPKFPVTRHKWVEPKDCQTASPSPSPVVTSAAPEPPAAELPRTGQDVGTQMAIGAAAGGLGLLLVGGLGVAWFRRRRSAVR